MDAIEFFKSKNRMCNFDCYKCPLSFCNNGAHESCEPFINHNPERAVAIVEQWAKEKPVKTRQSELLKLFPNARMSDGVIHLCPRWFGASILCQLDDCLECMRKYWLEEIS